MSKNSASRAVMMYKRPQCQNVFLKPVPFESSSIKIGLRFLGQSVLEVFHVKDRFRNKTAFNP